MELKKLSIHNYKSLVSFELIEPNAFTVFAGPNGAGKSNIFEALEFASYFNRISDFEVEALFGGTNSFQSFNSKGNVEVSIEFDSFYGNVYFYSSSKANEFLPFSTGFKEFGETEIEYLDDSHNAKRTQRLFLKNFLRLFIKKSELNRIKYISNERLLPDASNLESVLKRILKDKAVREEFLEWLGLFIPGFENLEIYSDPVGGTDTLQFFEKGTRKAFTRNLISDGTYNILALLTAVYQTSEPQFLCIEEPENGLNPYVVESLVDFFRRQCEEKGHVIWLNTHSQTLVNKLRPEELVLIDKVNGETKAKQFPKD